MNESNLCPFLKLNFSFNNFWERTLHTFIAEIPFVGVGGCNRCILFYIIPLIYMGNVNVLTANFVCHYSEFAACNGFE